MTLVSTPLRHALLHKDQLKKQFYNKKIILFLDYDGTLTPIANHPDLAILSPKEITCLRELAKKYITAIISGRQIENLQSLVNIDELFYAGNHGLQVSGPQNINLVMGIEFIEPIQKVYK